MDTELHKLDEIPLASEADEIPLASADYARIAKRQKSLPQTRILFIPCYCDPIDASPSNVYQIYFVDLTFGGNSVDDDTFVSVPPALRLDRECYDADALCVLNSTLYMFQSCYTRDRKTNPLGKSVATLELSDYLNNSKCNSIVELKKDMMSYAPEMHHMKRSPIATPTPDGKLLVFSSSIDPARQIDFELYDPNTKSWQELPGIFDNWDKNRTRPRYSFRIETFAFLKESTLFLQTKFGKFELDLRSPNTRGWQELDTVAGAREVPRYDGFFSVIEDELCFTSDCAFDINTPNGLSICSRFPFTVLDDTDYYESQFSCGIAFLDRDAECNFCLIETAMNKHTRCPHMTIDVYRCHLAKYREDKQKLKQGETAKLSTSIYKSFRFLLDNPKCSYLFPLGACFVSEGTS